MAEENENRCAKCGRGNPVGMRFCGFCGSPLAAAYATPAGADAPPPDAPEPAPVVPPVAPTIPPEDLDRTMEVRIAAPPVAPVLPSPVAVKPTVSPTPAVPPPNVPKDPVAREIERDRLMSQVNLFRARGQVTDARETLEKALFYADPAGTAMEKRARATMLEELGDLLMVEERYEEAGERFQQAMAADQGRSALVEKKYAAAQIAISDREAEKRLGQAVLKDDSIAEILKNDGLSGRSGRRNAGMAMILSVIVPGFGQFYNGQFVKGAILLATFALSLLIISLSPDKDNLFGTLAAMFALKQGRLAPPSGLIVSVAVIGFIAWLYSVVDSVFYANQTSDTERPLSVVDKSGWEP